MSFPLYSKTSMGALHANFIGFTTCIDCRPLVDLGDFEPEDVLVPVVELADDDMHEVVDNSFVMLSSIEVILTAGATPSVLEPSSLYS